MKKLNVIFNCILQIFFVIIFLSTLKAKNLDKFNKGNYISDYFSGILLLNENKYNKSYEYLKNLDGLEENHINYSTNYIYSLVNSEKINEAFIYSKKLEKKSLDTFQSDLITGVFYLKRKNFDLAKKYFLKIKNRNSKFLLDDFLTDSLLNWSSLSNLNLASAQNNIEVMSTKFENLKEIQKVFLHCYYQSQKTELLFKKLISNKKVDFSRYNYFYVSYLVGLKNIERAKAIISSSTDLYPNNLLLQQLNIDFEKGKFKSDFNCQNQSHTIAEIFYITANAMSTQRMYRLSNFYLNLAKYLNDDFQTFETLLAENYFNIENFELALKIYGKIEKKGGAYEWYSAKQIAKILIEQKNNYCRC